MSFHEQDRSGGVTPRFAKGLARSAQRCFAAPSLRSGLRLTQHDMPGFGFHYRADTHGTDLESCAKIHKSSTVLQVPG